MKRRRKRGGKTVEMQMGPMIDMVFLLLVFFMVSARPVKEEADIPIGLPGQVSQEEAVEIPDEQRIEIKAGGQIVLNDLELGKPGDSELQNLIAVLERFRKSAESSGSDPLVTLAPEDSALHQRIVDVLNACAVAKIRGVTFAQGGAAEGGEL
ncbi:MAG: biopolymer transporter ExbD [Verrucomicrobiales bacterium]